MKVCMVFVALAIVACSIASPIAQQEQQEQQQEQQQQQQQQGIVLSRMRRVTCDLLSIDTKFGSLNHAACAAHCISMNRGFKGGRCMDGVCNCRR